MHVCEALKIVQIEWVRNNYGIVFIEYNEITVVK